MFQTSSNDIVYVVGVTLQNKTLKFFSHIAKLKSLLKLFFFFFLHVKKMNLGILALRGISALLCEKKKKIEAFVMSCYVILTSLAKSLEPLF